MSPTTLVTFVASSAVVYSSSFLLAFPLLIGLGVGQNVQFLQRATMLTLPALY